MLRPSLLSLLVTLECFLHVSARPVPLYIPGAIGDGPITADPIGTDTIGYTTWRLGRGIPSGTFTGSQSDVTPLPSATLVVGSTDAHFLMVASSTTVREDCVFATGASGGPSLAFCKTFSADPTFTTTVAVVETAIPKDVQVPSESVDGGRSGQVFTGLLTWAQAILRSTGLNV